MKFVFALLLMLPTVAIGQVNKCLDARGKVVGYASECPAGSKAEKMEIKSAPPTASGEKQKSLAEREADFRKRQIEKKETEAKAAKKEAQSAEQKRACSDAQSYLRSLKDGQRIPRTDAKTGERAYLPDSEYPKEMARAQEIITANCK